VHCVRLPSRDRPNHPVSLAPAAETHEQGSERLERALAGLNAAIDNQRLAVASWRAALTDLSKVVSGLSGSLQRYRNNLDELAGRVGALHAQAVQLERTADAAMGTCNA
jgi:uncharacterized coiled-coil protein SlyX